MHHGEIEEASPHQALSLQSDKMDTCVVELEYKNGQESEAGNKQSLLKLLNAYLSHFEVHHGIWTFKRQLWLLGAQNEAGDSDV